jgi:hypothetical protein
VSDAIEPIESLMSVEELRREYRHFVDDYYALLYALRDAPEIPPARVLLSLSTSSRWPEDWNKGKELQRQHGLVAIPPKTECESGAGAWFRIRAGLLQSTAR